MWRVGVGQALTKKLLGALAAAIATLLPDGLRAGDATLGQRIVKKHATGEPAMLAQPSGR